jgi:phosphonate transport system substrate-binding protein
MPFEMCRHAPMNRVRVACAALVLVCGTGCSQPATSARTSGRAGWPNQLTFAMGVNPEDSEAVLRNAPFVERIQQATGIPIEFFTGTSFSSVVEAMRARRIDGMQVGVFSYLLAEKEAGAEAVAVYISTSADPAVYDPRLRPEYNGIFIAKKGSGIRSLGDLKGRTLNFGDPAGTSDHLVPKTELIKAGIVPDRDVKTRFAGNHASAILSLWHGTADAATTADSALRRFAAGGQVEYCDFPDHEIGRAHSVAEMRAVYEACPEGKLVTIHSVPIPGTPFALRGDLPDDLKAAITGSLLSTPGDPEFIRAAKRWYVDPSVALKLPDIFAYYESVRDLAKLLDLDLRRVKN